MLELLPDCSQLVLCLLVVRSGLNGLLRYVIFLIQISMMSSGEALAAGLSAEEMMLKDDRHLPTGLGLARCAA